MVASLVAAAFLAGVSGWAPAQAVTGIDRCPKGSFCGYSQTDFRGQMLVVKTNMPTMGSWDNKIQSWVNGSARIVCLYSAADYALVTWPGSR